VAVGYGLGILSFNGLLGHNGGILGYSSWVMHDPDTGVSIVVVTNRGGNEGGTSDPIFIQLATHLFPERFAALSGATPAASATG
jgi:D-alanyl-D-alanine carboxypeptidase